jgi:hypothetical protein
MACRAAGKRVRGYALPYCSIPCCIFSSRICFKLNLNVEDCDSQQPLQRYRGIPLVSS